MKAIAGSIRKTGIEKIFTIIRVLLAVSPFMALAYLSMNNAKYGGSLQTVLSSNPTFTVMFLVAMINPFIAYLLKYVQEHLEAGDGRYALLNLGLMIAAEIMIGNLLYTLALAFLVYKCMKTYDISLQEEILHRTKGHLLRDISGSIVLIVFAGICMFARMRLGM
jgi:hypothetical protein